MEAVADQAYSQLLTMGFMQYSFDQVVDLVQWHMAIMPKPWYPPQHYVNAIVDHVLRGALDNNFRQQLLPMAAVGD